ncbi:MAG TPA: hypothetical protein PKY56_11110, partial [Candidatus Kapabacteria bacterium]|nr:hypothetical protein [Candidatus Kapabacteria bacterium]
THLPFEKDSLWFVCRDSYYYDSLINHGKTVQPMWERSLYESYYKPDTKLSEMLYSDKPWWLYHLLYNVQNENEHIVFNYYRPKTGEEIRMLLNSSLIRGCKGFIYDGDENYHFPNCHMGNMGIGDGTRICDTSDVFSNWVGSDYIDSINNTWNAFNYAKLDTLAKRMGISRNKVYIGTRSIRTELFNFHSKIRRADEELMKLRLVASYSKGFRVQQNHHPDYPDDSTFRRFLAWDTTRNRLDTTQFKSWPYRRYYKVPGNPDPDVHIPVYESWDSTFIDFTLLKNVDSSINDLAFIGIQNRRTDPLIAVRYSDSIYVGTDSARLATLYRFSFYSTAEFEDSCDAIKNPNSYQDFRYKWFSRAGCRTVTLPFNYVNTSNPDEYALLRITELGADSTFDSTWSYSRKMAYWRKIDTVIGQDRSITFNMLPGEGKIFRIRVLHQDTTVTGSLLCSNQSKLVSYPLIRPDGTESDSIRYHLVYHKQITFPDNFSGNAVFYRRSKIVSKDCMEENIVWESAVLVSDNINDIQNPYISCDYPSIVVRKDIDTLKAYIVYSCSNNGNDGMIVETILSVNDNIVLDKRGNKLADYSGSDRAEWGNPVVNASGNGNYYAWSDEAAGIVAAWKAPNETSFQANNKINFKYSDYPVTRAPQQHPSLNVYSHLDSLEDNCALVWQEYIPTDSKSRILYTRLRHNGNSLYKYLSPVFLNDPIVYGIKDNMAMLDSSNSLKYRYPVINRGLGLYRVSPPSNSARRRYDLVYWETNNGLFEPLNNYLINVLVWNQDTSNVPIQWSVSWCNYIKSYYKCIGLPNISQFLDAGLFMSPYYTSLNFIYYDSFLNSLVGHFKYDSYNTHSFVTTQTSPDPDYIDWTDANELWVKRVDSGTLPHLSKNKQPLGEMWNNRRVYQQNTSYWSNIITSAKYFYKGQSDEMLADWYIGFETADSSKKSFLFGAPELDEQRFSLKLPFEKV